MCYVTINLKALYKSLLARNPAQGLIFTVRLLIVHFLIRFSEQYAWSIFWIHQKLGMIIMVYIVIVLAFCFFDCMSIPLIFITSAHICENAMPCCSMSVFEEQAEICKIILVWEKNLAGIFVVVIQNIPNTHNSQ